MLFLFVFSFANLPGALYNIIFTPRFKKNTPTREVDTQYSEPRFAVRKRKIVTQRNWRESNPMEREDRDRNATRPMSLQDEIPVRIRMDHSV